MIMLTVTKPRRKLKRILKGGALLLLLGVVVPGIYYSLESMGAMSLFASGDTVVQSEQAEQGGQNAQAEQMQQIEPKQQTGQLEQTAPVESTESNAQNEQIEQNEANEQPSAALDAAAPEEMAAPEEQTAAEDGADKPGLWQRLKAVLFGEKSEVVPY